MDTLRKKTPFINAVDISFISRHEYQVCKQVVTLLLFHQAATRLACCRQPGSNLLRSGEQLVPDLSNNCCVQLAYVHVCDNLCVFTCVGKNVCVVLSDRRLTCGFRMQYWYHHHNALDRAVDQIWI